MDLLKMIQENWVVISQAPFAFTAMVLLATTGGFFVGRFFLSEKVSNLESRLTQRDDVIEEYKNKLSGASPDQAQQKIADLERRLDALEPRVLRQDQIALLSAIAATQPGNLQVYLDAAASDQVQISRQISSALAAVGWAVRQGTVMGLGNPPETGILIASKKGDTPTVEATVLMRAFDAIGLAYNLETRTEVDHGGYGVPTELTITKPL